MTPAISCVGLQLAFAGVGYAVLGHRVLWQSTKDALSWFGVALLAGAGLTGVVLTVLAVVGLRPDLKVVVVVLVAVTGVGLVSGNRSGTRSPGLRPPTAQHGTASQAITAALTSMLVVLAMSTIYSAFRVEPFLDDTWTQWLPRGLALEAQGLDSPPFRSSTDVIHFPHLDYPLWWSVVVALPTTLAGEVDVRTTNGQVAILLAAFVAAVARLLWGHVRPLVLVGALLLIVGAPELLRQTYGGAADVPLALYSALAVVAAGLWVSTGDRLYLIIFTIAAATTLATKNEALLGLAAGLLAFGAPAWSVSKQRALALLAAMAVVFATSVPWLLWRGLNDIPADVSFGDSMSVLAGLENTERIGPTLRSLTEHFFDPMEWLVIVPATLALSVLAAARTRRWQWLAPAVWLVVGFVVWTLSFWTGPYEIRYWLGTAAYRVIDPVLIVAGVCIPVLLERILQTFRRQQAPVQAT